MSEIRVSAIRADAAAQPREHLNYDVVTAYAEEMRSGTQFPPVIVFEEATADGSIYWLADGFHRHAAAVQARVAMISAEIHQGTLRDAILYSVGTNADHGLQRSNEDKRRAVRRLLDDAEWAKWSDSEISRRCRVSQPFVSKMRPAVVTHNVISDERAYTTKHGTISTMKTAAIGSRREALDAPVEHASRAVEGTSTPEPRGAEHPAADRARPREAESDKAESEAPQQASDLHQRDTDAGRRSAPELVAQLLALPDLDGVEPDMARAVAAKLTAHADMIEAPAPRPAALFALQPVSPLSKASTPRAAKADVALIEREFARDFWPQVPKKVGRADALKAFTKARKHTPLDVIVAGILRYAASREGEDPQFTKSAAAWLNGRRWEDEAPPTSQHPRERMSRAQSATEGLMSYGRDLNGE